VDHNKVYARSAPDPRAVRPVGYVAGRRRGAMRELDRVSSLESSIVCVKPCPVSGDKRNGRRRHGPYTTSSRLRGSEIETRKYSKYYSTVSFLVSRATLVCEPAVIALAMEKRHTVLECLCRH
jgi:hypothetical protein